MPEVYFHLGLPKTATTYLQTEFFPRLTGIRYFKKSLFKKYPRLIKSAKEDKLLFSNEIHRGFESKLLEVLEDYPQAHIIYVFRRQDQWLTSRYKYHIRKNGSATFREFFNLDENTGRWKIEEVSFRKRIEFIRANCQKEPLFLNFDELKTNKKTFALRICTYLGCPVPPDFSEKVVKGAMQDRQLRVMRAYNKRFPYTKLKSSSTFLNLIHMRWATFKLLVVARIAWLIPGRLLGREELIPSSDLADIQAYFAEDWAYVEQICNNQ